jgi:hypothetical protein
MTLQTLSAVHAIHDIRRGRQVVVKHGSPGKVVDAHPTWSGTTYTVEFAPKGKKHRGDTVTVMGVAESDLTAQ